VNHISSILFFLWTRG